MAAHRIERGVLHAATLTDGSEGFVRAADRKLPDRSPAPSAFLLHTQDPLVRSHASELRRRFGKGALAYLLVDGEFRGAARGRWKMGPYDVEDVALDLPAAELERRRDEILAAVAKVYPEPRHRILGYAGARL